MSGIIEGYSYDIFISYRQKDNKGDRWVSEFVETLKTELESTFKEEISVYFDINPHDGLLETYDVDASLKDKLKCLVFIPVISRTYCDPRSFAWEHEFIAFIEQASADRFGLKVRLPNGNVATRVLPVRIHELDQQDIRLCENAMGGPLRGIEFIYKSTGVNRPLRISEDSPKDNQNHTFYRDQINKVANAISEIIYGMQVQNAPGKQDDESIPEKLIFKPNKPSVFTRKVWFFTIAIIFIGVAIVLLKTRGEILFENEHSIAFLPFRSSGSDYELVNQGNNFAEAIYGKLEKLESLTVIPRISTLQYRDTELPLSRIRRLLKSNFLIGGMIWREEGRTMVSVELSESRNGSIVWTGDYTWDKNNIGQVTNDIINVVIKELKIILTPGELRLVMLEPSGNADANMNYISANSKSIDSRFYMSYDYDAGDSSSFLTAIRSYDKAIELDPDFAQAYIRRSLASSWGIYLKQLDSSFILKSRNDIEKAISLNKDLPEIHIAKGFYYYYCLEKLDSALISFAIAAEQDSDDYQALFYMAMVNRRIGDWNATRKLLWKVIPHNPREALFLTNIGMTYYYMHQYDSALLFHQKAIDLMPKWRAAYVNKLLTVLAMSGKTSDAWKVQNEAKNYTGDDLAFWQIQLHECDGNFEKALAVTRKLSEDVFENSGDKLVEIAEIYTWLNKPDSSQIYYDSAVYSLKKALTADPGNYFLHRTLGKAFAGKGLINEARHEGETAIALAKVNSMDASDLKIDLAQIFLMTGDKGKALDLLGSLLNSPSQISAKLLQTDPAWRQLTGLNEFRDLIRTYN